MLKMAAAGITALLVAASPLAYAQNQTANSQEQQNAGEPSDVTNLRIEVLQSALQLTPDQQQYWPPVEAAIRQRAQHRFARLENFAGRVSDQGDSSLIEMALKSNPVDRMHRRADALAQRSADLKKLADAWQPLYASLNTDQKRRLALVRVIAFRAVMNRIRGSDDDDYSDQDQQ